MRIAVIGGGIAGVAAAYALKAARPDVHVDVYEGSPQLGGKLQLGSVAGVSVDVGAESILNLRPEGVELARAAGLGALVVHPEPVSAAIWTGGALRPMPPTVMGIPSDLDRLESSGIMPDWPAFSRSLCVSVAMATQTHRGRSEEGDMSVADFVRSRLGADAGQEIVDRLIEPLLGGVYAGHADELSLQSAAPQIAALGDDLIASAAQQVTTQLSSGRGRAPVFAGLAGGVGQLPTAVAEASGATIHLNSTVRELERTESGWRLVVGPTVAAEHVEVDAVIVATPGPATARLIATAAPTAAYGIGGIDYASMAIITLALPTGGFAQPLVGSGFLVPPVDGKAVKAATFSTNKWGWLADAAGPDLTLLRCSIGRAGEATLLHRDDPELIAAALGDLREAVGATGEPVDAHVQRWGGALPQYNVGHRDRVDAVTADVATVPGLELCGAAYAGVGIPAVIANAQGAAVRLLERLGTIGI